jgi:hypothetical protein
VRCSGRYDLSSEHASVISLLSPQGEILRQSSMLGKADPQLLELITRGTE